ncbi:MAG TPA: hypothetical protein VIF83_10345 [Gemmatimonadaceae bacterium]|jgi:hypothetical protein
MNRMTLTFAIAATAALAAPLAAQGRGRNVDGIPPGHRPPPGMCRIWIDGVPPGRQPRATDCATAERNRPANARVIYGDNTRSGIYDRGDIYDRNGDGRIDSRDRGCAWYDINCTNTRDGDIYDRNGDGRIDSRDRNNSGCAWYDPNCVGNRSDRVGSWQVAGRDSYGRTIYVRRRVDSNGNVIIERARRNSLGQMVVIDRQVQSRGSRNGGGKYDRVLNGRRNDDYDDDDRWDRRDRDDDRYYDGSYGKSQGHGKYKVKGKKNKNR